MSDKKTNKQAMTRRQMLRHLGVWGGGVYMASLALQPRKALGQVITEEENPCAAGGVNEFFPTSPLILEPFDEELPVPRALAPSNPSSWEPWGHSYAPPGPYQQDCDGQTHQLYCNQLGLPDPIYYKIKLQVEEHSFSKSKVLPINSLGQPVQLPPGCPVSQGSDGTAKLPPSTIYGFNGTFPGPRINAEYGRPVCIRFENHLGENEKNLDRCDFGAPDYAFLTHLHNAHTACESDGNPSDKEEGYAPDDWCDNLYLNYPAGGDDREKQSFLWFHDHRMDHTGANVYKGMVGLFPIYDPANDSGDERRRGYRLPGVRKNNRNGSFDVDYDIPLAFYDCCLDDGVTPHLDWHNGCGETRPEWWGKTFFRHYPNHGFVGDVFTVNCKAYPVHEVKRRRYRLRFLDASIARCYKFELMSSTNGPVASKDTELRPGVPRTGVHLQGQYQLPDGEQCMIFTQVATDGGLLPFPIIRDSFELWPAKRREFIVDFTKYMDGTPTTKGDVIYLVNTMQMTDGRKPDEREISDDPVTGLPLPNEIPNPDFDTNYKVPVLKFVIGDDAPDDSIDPLDYSTASTDGRPKLKMNPATGMPVLTMRPLPPLPADMSSLPRRHFKLERSGKFGGEVQWLINDKMYDPHDLSITVPQGSGELWTFETGGGWVHPLHLHMEEHRVISRDGDKAHPDDNSREDVIAMDPGEEITIFRRFRTFKGPYVTHCHNLAHEDHAMMFGWKIV